MTISGITITGTDSGDFGQSNNCPISPAARASNTRCVTFKPTAIGSRSGTLTVSDNAAGSPQTVGLTGTSFAALRAPLRKAAAIILNHHEDILQSPRGPECRTAGGAERRHLRRGHDAPGARPARARARERPQPARALGGAGGARPSTPRVHDELPDARHCLG